MNVSKDIWPQCCSEMHIGGILHLHRALISLGFGTDMCLLTYSLLEQFLGPVSIMARFKRKLKTPLTSVGIGSGLHCVHVW